MEKQTKRQTKRERERENSELVIKGWFEAWINIILKVV